MRFSNLAFMVVAAAALAGCGDSGGSSSAGRSPQPIVDLAQKMIAVGVENEPLWDVDALAILSAPDDAETLDL